MCVMTILHMAQITNASFGRAEQSLSREMRGGLSVPIERSVCATICVLGRQRSATTQGPANDTTLLDEARPRDDARPFDDTVRLALSVMTMRARMPVTWRRDVARELGKCEPYCVIVAPSHAASSNPVPSRNVELDFIRNADRIGNDDARAFVGCIENKAGQRVATVVEIDATAQVFRIAYGSAPLLHFYLQASARPPKATLRPRMLKVPLRRCCNFHPMIAESDGTQAGGRSRGAGTASLRGAKKPHNRPHIAAGDAKSCGKAGGLGAWGATQFGAGMRLFAATIRRHFNAGEAGIYHPVWFDVTGSAADTAEPIDVFTGCGRGCPQAPKP
jgi:hypothetical protein